MKVGIITFQNADNYGALLQCYGLFKYLSNQGYDVEVIDYNNPVISKGYIGLPPFQKNIIKWSKKTFDRFKNRNSIKERHSRFEDFRKLIVFSETKTKKQIQRGLSKYNVLITGSDQVWNPKITKGFDPIYFLDFPGAFYKCAYAVSLGNIAQKDYLEDKFLEYLRFFDKLSFREKDACEFVFDKFGIESEQTLDPTFLLKKEDWAQIANKGRRVINEPYLLLYYLDNNPELTLIAKDIAKQYNLKIICCNKTFKNDDQIIWVSSIGPQDFLRLILEANIVITSSFHASAFSVIFKKEFYTTLHKETGSRVKNLLHVCNMDSCIFEGFDDYKNRFNKVRASSTGCFSTTELDNLLESSYRYLDFSSKLKE